MGRGNGRGDGVNGAVINSGVSDGGISDAQRKITVDDRSGLNPNRQKGFGSSGASRIETPSLNEMKAKQGAIVARFMTFFQRKSSIVIELYNGAFYKHKPTWDKIADFVCNDLCATTEQRQAVTDVQFHPVKMLIFVKCVDDDWRDALVSRLQSREGIVWKDYGVKVKGYGLDAEVKFIRVLVD